MKPVKKLCRILSAIAMTVVMTVPVCAKDIKDYNDIPVSVWYRSYVRYVSEQDIMTGLNETTFGATNTLARAQFSTILYRMAGSPEVTYEKIFPDVLDGEFYSLPVTWAKQNNVITGYESTGNFGPADPLTREQMVTMMYRFAEMSGEDVSARKDYSGFADANQVTKFADEAMQWAVAEGIIQGSGEGLLSPTGNIIRAESAAIIARYKDVQVHMPETNGCYVNSTNGGFPHTSEIRLEAIDDNSFKFSVWEIIDKNGEPTEKELISERIATFESNTSGIAVSSEGGVELRLDCSTFGKIIIRGLDTLDLGNTFSLMAAEQYAGNI